MNLEQLKETSWFKGRPPVIQEAINVLPPTKLYMFKDSGKQCRVYSYDEPESGLFEDVTVTVQKTGIGGPMDKMGLGMLDTNAVFGVHLDSLVEYKESGE